MCRLVRLSSLLVVLFSSQSVFPVAGDIFFDDLLRGDANDSGVVDQSDSIAILNYVNNGSPVPGCLDAADADDNGLIQNADATYILNWKYSGGPPPPNPGPYNCGPDPTADSLTCADSQCGS